MKLSILGVTSIGVVAALGFVLILNSISSNIVHDSVIDVNLLSDELAPAAFVSTSTQELKRFSSLQELTAFLTSIEISRNALISASGGTDSFGQQAASPRLTDSDSPQQEPWLASPSESAPASRAEERGDHSTTNIQILGVDEPDFLKNDERYAYILSGDRLTILEVYPPKSALVIANMDFNVIPDQYMQNMFLNNNTLAVLYQQYVQDIMIAPYEIVPQSVYVPETHVLILDITDRANPNLVKKYTVSGAYNDARMIGDNVYIVTTSDLYNYRHPLIPKVAVEDRILVTPDIYYFDNPYPYYNFNTVTSVNIKSAQDAVNAQTFMMNPASTLYVSEKSIYIAYAKYQPYYDIASRDRFFDSVVPLLPPDINEQIRSIDADSSQSESQKWDRMAAVLQDMYNRMSEQEKVTLLDKIQQALVDYDERIQKEAQRTVIHRIAINSSGEIIYLDKGEVPGRVLNSFSMHERDDRLRIATTVEYYSRYSSGLYNNVYVLDERMQVVGKLEHLEPGESIYAARFVDDKLYLVTFQRIDPFLVIDLSADHPKVLGELKLSGYSNYLHLYDEDHILEIGKDTKENEFGGVEEGGVKLALFDVSDVLNPRLVDSFVIGDAGTESEVLWDHKALLFDRTKDILSIPIVSYDGVIIDDGRYMPSNVWRGFYIFGLSPDAGFVLKGTVEHSGVNDYYFGLQGSRSFYINDVLYTLSLGNKLKMNEIDTLATINELEIEGRDGIVPYPIPLPEPVR